MAAAVVIFTLLTFNTRYILLAGSLVSTTTDSSLAHVVQQRLIDVLSSLSAPYGYRSGEATRTHSCGYVREVPQNLRFSWLMKPRGLPAYYQKYTEAYNIPVLGSANVSDNAMRRACYVLRFMLADHYSIRQTYFKLFGRLVVIGPGEKINAVPEYRFLSDSWNNRSRGLGATETVPVSSGAEENLLCFGSTKDVYYEEDILIHELTHGLHLLGSKHVIPGFQLTLNRSFENSTGRGLWKDTYSADSMEEYLAEAVQSYFKVNGYRNPPDGVHGPVNSPEKLRAYDPSLYELVQLMFPCGNTFIKRCNSTREAETSQVLKMDCDLTRQYQIKISELAAQSGQPCQDGNDFCTDWSLQGECTSNPAYMKVHCRKSCLWCNLKENLVSSQSSVIKNCTDQNILCPDWAAIEECTKNSAYMKINCKHSCGLC
uniref:ShKT domain-containing protein n=1 Tax=Biomphalaria glabrata TaxID=6526 RepID=A0A2C9LZT2_BIOGL